MNPDPGPRVARYPLRLRRRPVRWERQVPTWRQARPAVIAGALHRALARPSGNWFVVGATADVTPTRPLSATVADTEVVVWRDARGRLVGGPGQCPHLGAPLGGSPVRCGTLVCRWHGLSLDGSAYAGWEPLPVHDDGVLVWVRLDAAGGEEPTRAPVVPVRPALAASVHAVWTGVGTCEPRDVVANRLDPWHGAWFHPYSFVDLTVVRAPGDGDDGEDGEDGEDGDAFVVDVSFRLARRIVVPVRAEFTAPEPRTVLMRITGGEGAGSVVETHATPLGPDELGRPRTAVVEAVLATSERPGFALARALAPALRPLMRTASGRLWRDDLAYAERLRDLRERGRKERGTMMAKNEKNPGNTKNTKKTENTENTKKTDQTGSGKDEKLARGDEVAWNSHGSTTEGTVEREITRRTEAAGRTVDASPDDPQYEVRSAKSGKSAVHKPSALRRKRTGD